MKDPSAGKKEQFVWGETELALLGKVSDGELSRRTGLKLAEVRKKRLSLGIQPSRPRKTLTWGDEEIALLGRYPDAEVAKLLRTYRKTVIAKRQALGIPSYARGSNRWHTWTKAELAMLGKVKDSEAARLIGIPTACVTARRRLLKIPGFLGGKGRRPSCHFPAQDEKAMALLGTMPDRYVAERLHLTSDVVRRKRKSLGIAPWSQNEGRRKGIWTDEVVERLGRERCSKIARDIGVTGERVRQKCKELGIVPFVVRESRREDLSGKSGNGVDEGGAGESGEPGKINGI